MPALTHTERNSLLDAVIEAAKIGGAILRERFGKKKNIRWKSEIDPVTDTDIAIERAIVDYVFRRFPGHDIIAEESSLPRSGSPFRWIVDPLDGTVNFSHNHPVAAVSVAIEVDGAVEAGAVFNPVFGELFHAVRGGGAFLNGEPIRVSLIDDLGRSLLATGFPYDIRENPYNNLAHFCHMAKKAQAVRRDGSAALNLCYTAAGRFEGYWELVISPWDIAAGSLIVTEAGGRMSDLSGGDFSLWKRQVLATNGLVHDALVRELAVVGVRPPDGDGREA